MATHTFARLRLTYWDGSHGSKIPVKRPQTFTFIYVDLIELVNAAWFPN